MAIWAATARRRSRRRVWTEWPGRGFAGYCGQSHPNATYAGMISRLDRSVGRILDLLDELKLSEDTLVIFSSDNGPSPEGGQSLKFFNSTGPLSGAKRSMREGGIRIPMIARWPGKIQPGRTSSHPSAFWDFLPTACELAGIEPPADTDGISYLPELLGRPEALKKHEYFYWIWAVRVGKWKLHPRGKNRYALYDLENDIAEKHDLADQMPDVVARRAHPDDPRGQRQAPAGRACPRRGRAHPNQLERDRGQDRAGGAGEGLDRGRAGLHRSRNADARGPPGAPSSRRSTTSPATTSWACSSRRESGRAGSWSAPSTSQVSRTGPRRGNCSPACSPTRRRTALRPTPRSSLRSSTRGFPPRDGPPPAPEGILGRAGRSVP